jgi:hypothetical protein
MATNETKDPTTKKCRVLDFWGLVVPNVLSNMFPITSHFIPQHLSKVWTHFKQYSHLLLFC